MEIDPLQGKLKNLGDFSTFVQAIITPKINLFDPIFFST